MILCSRPFQKCEGVISSHPSPSDDHDSTEATLPFFGSVQVTRKSCFIRYTIRDHSVDSVIESSLQEIIGEQKFCTY